MSRPLIGERPLTPAEKMRRYRARLAGRLPPFVPKPRRPPPRVFEGEWKEWFDSLPVLELPELPDDDAKAR
jgi:hypothetical protein